MPARSAGSRVSLLELDLALVDALERASILTWPPSHVEECGDGWILRATPGIERGRSSFALTPRRRGLEPGELPQALERIRAWSSVHGIRGGVQVSPLELHGDAVGPLLAAGWQPVWRCWVMAVDRLEALERAASLGLGRPAAEAVPGWTATREATRSWQENWLGLEPRHTVRSVQAQVRTVFAAMDGRGIFGRLGDVASGIAVEDGSGEWAGLFCLVVRADRRGEGVGRQLVRCLLETTRSRRVFLQVVTDNTTALALYRSFGFRISHSYHHLLAPAGWARGAR